MTKEIETVFQLENFTHEMKDSSIGFYAKDVSFEAVKNSVVLECEIQYVNEELNGIRYELILCKHRKIRIIAKTGIEAPLVHGGMEDSQTILLYLPKDAIYLLNV